MRKYRRIWLIILTLAALGALIWLILPAREPAYQGKPLHEWLALYTSGMESDVVQPPSQVIGQAEEAIRHMGANAIPTLLVMIQEDDSPLKLKWIALMRKQHLFKAPQEAQARNVQAVWGFRALGPEAVKAVPELVRTFRKNDSHNSQAYVLRALALINIGTAALPAVTPVFLAGLTNANSDVREQAAIAIAQYQGSPNVFVPALIKALKDANPEVRMYAAFSLGEYGSQAKSAVPGLVPLLNDPDFYIRKSAADALKQIDFQAAAKAGVK